MQIVCKLPLTMWDKPCLNAILVDEFGAGAWSCPILLCTSPGVLTKGSPPTSPGAPRVCWAQADTLKSLPHDFPPSSCWVSKQLGSGWLRSGQSHDADVAEPISVWLLAEVAQLPQFLVGSIGKWCWPKLSQDQTFLGRQQNCKQAWPWSCTVDQAHHAAFCLHTLPSPTSSDALSVLAHQVICLMGAGTGKSHQNFKFCGHLAGANFVPVSPGPYVILFSLFFFFLIPLKWLSKVLPPNPPFTLHLSGFTLCAFKPRFICTNLRVQAIPSNCLAQSNLPTRIGISTCFPSGPLFCCSVTLPCQAWFVSVDSARQAVECKLFWCICRSALRRRTGAWSFYFSMARYCYVSGVAPPLWDILLGFCRSLFFCKKAQDHKNCVLI